MNAPVPADVGIGWRAALDAAMRSWRTDAATWVYIFKTLFASLLALWIAFRLGLQSPRSAMLTVFIVANPQAGLVLAKSFFRVVGTLTGSAATLVIVGLFSSQRDLLLAAMVVWIGLCTTAAAWRRNLHSYAFVLAGYTAAIIGFPAALRPEMAFQIAVDRVSTVGVGILCAGIAADLILPTRTNPGFMQALRGSYGELLTVLSRGLRRESDSAPAGQPQARFIASAIAAETQREAAEFETPDLRVRSPNMAAYNVEFMAAATSAHMAIEVFERLRRLAPAAIADFRPLCLNLAQELESLAGLAAKPASLRMLQLSELKDRLRTLESAVLQSAGRRLDAAALLDLECAVDLLHRLAAAIESLTLRYGDLDSRTITADDPGLNYAPQTEWVSAVLGGVRSMVTLSVMSAFWILAAWPNGASAAIIATVFCGLFAAAPFPVKRLSQTTLGVVLGGILAVVMSQGVLVRLDGFPLLVAGLVPVLMLTLKLSSDPQTAGIGFGATIVFVVNCGVENVTTFDALPILNDGLAVTLGALAAVAAYALIVPTDSAFLRRYLVHRLNRRIRQACRDPLAGLRHRFDSKTRDLCFQLIAGAKLDRSEDFSINARALFILEIGRAIINLREEANSLHVPSVEFDACVRTCLTSIDRYIDRPTQSARLRALNDLAAARLRVGGLVDTPDSAMNAAVRRTQVALRTVELVLSDDNAVRALAPEGLPGAPHAT